jgi:hypothetical protein
MSNCQETVQTIYAYQEGKCIELKDLVEKGSDCDSELQKSTDFEKLSLLIKNISTTINKNAQYMLNIGKQQNNLEKIIFNFLNSSSNNMNLYFKNNEEKPNVMLEDKNAFETLSHFHCDLEKKFLKSFNEEKRNLSLTEKKLQNFENLLNNLKNKKDEVDNSNVSKSGNIEKEMEEFKNQFNYKLNRIQNSILDYSSKDYVEVLFNDLKKCHDEETDVLREMIHKTNNKMTEIKNHEIFKQSINLSQGEKKQKENDKRFIKIEEEVENLKETNLGLKKKIKGLMKKLKKMIENNKGDKNEERLNNLEEKFTQNGVNIFETIDEIRPRLEILENTFEEKVDKEKLFDFLAENFVRKINFENERNKNEKESLLIKNIINDNDKEYKQFKFNIANKVEDLKHLMIPFKEKLEKLKKDFCEFISMENGGERMYNRLEKKIEKLHEFFIEKYTDKVNNLATTKGLQCLSCGERAYEYPPNTVFLKGKDDNIYCIPNKHFLYTKKTNVSLNESKQNLKKSSPDKKSKNTDIGESFKENKTIKKVNLKSDGSKKDFRLTSAKTSGKLSNLVNKNIVTGQTVFNNSHIISEHFFKSHLPLEKIIDNHLYTSSKLRPFSSIPNKSCK